MKMQVIEPLKYRGVRYAIGDEVDVLDEDRPGLVSKGLVEIPGSKPAKAGKGEKAAEG